MTDMTGLVDVWRHQSLHWFFVAPAAEANVRWPAAADEPMTRLAWNVKVS